MFCLLCSFWGIPMCGQSGAAENKKSSDVFYEGSYTDLSDRTINAKIEFYTPLNFQDSVSVVTSDGQAHHFHPSEIKSFSFSVKNKKISYERVTANEKTRFFALTTPGTFLKEYNYCYDLNQSNPSHATADVIPAFNPCFKKGDSLFLISSDEAFNDWMSRLVADDSLLSKMVNEKKLNFFVEDEVKFVLDEYNRWRTDGTTHSSADTSMALHGIADAEKYYKAKLPFVLTATAMGIGTPVVGIPVAFWIALKKPKLSSLKIRDSKLLSNTDYMNAYRIKAHEQKIKATLKGSLWGLGLFGTVILSNKIIQGKPYFFD